MTSFMQGSGLSKIFGGIVLVLLCVGVQAQTLEELQAKYPDKHACFLNMKKHLDISIVSGELKIKEYVTEEIMYLDDNVPSAVKDQVSYSSFFNLANLRATSYTPKGKGKFKRVPVKEFMENNNASSSSFHDDSKEKVFYFTQLKKGAKTKLEYQLDVVHPQLLPPAFVQTYYPVENYEYTISVAKGVDLEFAEFNLSDTLVQFKKTEKSYATIYSWTGSEVEDADIERDGPSPRYYLPQIHPFLVSATISGTTTEYLGNPTKLHTWYRSLIKDYDKDVEEDDTELKNIVDSLTADLDNDLDKVKAVYTWVQSNIQYIAFEYELAGFVPRPAAKVCSRRFGDCKDMSSIIVEMLDMADVKAYLTWIGTRDIPFSYDELATSSTDNHMIASYIDDKGKIYFLDGTDKYVSFGAPASHIQGKQALISLSPDEFKLQEVPVQDKSFSQLIDTAWIEIDGSKITGTGRMIKSGYYKTYSTYSLVGKNEKELLDYFKIVLRKGNNKFKLDSFEMKNLNDRDKPLDVPYKFGVEDYIQSFDDEIYVDMNFYNRIGTRIKDDRELAYEYRFAKQHRETYILKIPEGYDVTYVPENYEQSVKGFHYSVQYRREGDQLIYDIRLDRDVLMMDNSYFEDWNVLFDKMNEMFKETIVLKKK